MAKTYEFNIYITDDEEGVLHIPFLPEEFSIDINGNNATEYLANGDFISQLKSPQPMEIRIESFFPSNKNSLIGTIANNFRRPYWWHSYLMNLMNSKKKITLSFTKWMFNFDCYVDSYTPKITYAEVDDLYYTITLKEYKTTKLSTVTSLYGAGHNFSIISQVDSTPASYTPSKTITTNDDTDKATVPTTTQPKIPSVESATLTDKNKPTVCVGMVCRITMWKAKIGFTPYLFNDVNDFSKYNGDNEDTKLLLQHIQKNGKFFVEFVANVKNAEYNDYVIELSYYPAKTTSVLTKEQQNGDTVVVHKDETQGVGKKICYALMQSLSNIDDTGNNQFSQLYSNK